MEWPLLAGLDEHERRRVIALARRQRFAKREVVFHEGDLGDAFHLIDRGRFAVHVRALSGEVVTVGLLGAGDFFGERALLEPSARRTATVVALEPAHTLVLHGERFVELRTSSPTVDRFLVAMFATQAQRLSQELVEALYVPADQRVLRRLVSAAALWRDGSGSTVIPLTQEDVAGLAGTTRQTANRVLRQAEAEGLVVIGRGRIQIRNPPGLARRAGAG